MKWGLLAVLAAVVLAVWLTRPYSLDIARYAFWRTTEGRAFINGTVMSGDARIAWRTIGPLDPAASVDDSPPLLLLHGGLGTDLDWYAEIPTLARRHKLVLIDTRGHGGSTLGTQPLSYRLFVDDVLTVLDSLGLPTIDIAGWSDGGNTGLMIAHEHPDRVRRLVAISANAHPEGLVPRVREAVAREGAKGSVPARLLRAVFSPEVARWDELTAHITALWRAYPRLQGEHLSAIATPTLLIAGSEDDVRIGHLDEISDAMPRATLVVLPGVGHSVPQSAPRDVLEQMAHFLDPSNEG